MKYKFLLLFSISLLVLTSCGNNTETVSKNDVAVETEKMSETVETTETEKVLDTSENMEETESKIAETLVNTEITEVVEEETLNPQTIVVKELNQTMYAKSAVNVRKGDSTEYEKVGSLSFNQQVQVTGQSEATGWYRIEFNGETGFVSQNYLSTEKTANLHIIKTPDGIIAGSSALKEAINSSLNKHGISTNYQNDILVDYYNVTVNKDNTKIHNDVIDNLVSSLVDALKAQEQQQNQNQNTGSGSSSNNNQDYEENDSGVAPEDYTPEPSQPSPGEFNLGGQGVEDKTGGEIITDYDPIIP